MLDSATFWTAFLIRIACTCWAFVFISFTHTSASVVYMAFLNEIYFDLSCHLLLEMCLDLPGLSSVQDVLDPVTNRGVCHPCLALSSPLDQSLDLPCCACEGVPSCFFYLYIGG